MARFAIKSVHKWSAGWRPALASEASSTYEERIVILEAASNEEALELGFLEAESYAKDNKFEFLRRVDAYEIDEEAREIYSCLRLSEAGAEAFYDEHYRDRDAYKKIIEEEGKQ